MTGARCILLFVVPLTSFCLRAQSLYRNSSDSVEIQFRQSKWNLDRSVGNNGAVLDSIDRKLAYVQGDTIYKIKHVGITGSASPEGSESFNKLLSEKRAHTLFNHFSKYGKLASADKSYEYKGRDWLRVIELVELDTLVPFRIETLFLLKDIKAQKDLNGYDPNDALKKLKELKGGVPYAYLYHNIFPKVRSSRIILDYSKRLLPTITTSGIENIITSHIDSLNHGLELNVDLLKTNSYITNTVDSDYTKSHPIYLDFRTNMLYDILILPNIGIDIYFGRGLSLGVNWMYAWWSKDDRHFYWRAYGGEINLRWWPLFKRHNSPLCGLHIGVAGQVYTYDFELGKKGQIGGKPNGSIFDDAFWTADIECGYAIPIHKRLNVDLSLGIGYSTGLFYKFNPDHGHYVWESTQRRHYFGPTKLEISLVWLIGKGNFNKRKGGLR